MNVFSTTLWDGCHETSRPACVGLRALRVADSRSQTRGGRVAILRSVCGTGVIRTPALSPSRIYKSVHQLLRPSIMELLSGMLVVAFAVFLIGLSVLIAFKPQLAERFLRSFA